MAKPKSKSAAPQKKYTPDEVLERFRAKDDPALGSYARYAASHRVKLSKVEEKEKKQQEKQQLKDAQKKKEEKPVTPEDLYKEATDAAVYDEVYEDTDMPSSDIKGKIFRDYQPLSSAPSGKEAPKSVSAQISAPSSVPKPSVRDLTRSFNQKFAEQKKETEEKKVLVKKSTAKKVTKKLIRKTKSSIDNSQPPTSDLRPKTAPPLPPSKKVDPKYVKQQQEALKKQQEQEKKEAEKKAKADEAAKKEAEKARAANDAPSVTHHHRSPFKTGFWVMCGILAFFILLAVLFIIAIVVIASMTGTDLWQNGTIVLP